MRVAVIADIHGNAPALAAVLEDIAAVGADALVNLGDVFSGPVDPAGTFALLSERAALTIRGNHDRFLLDPADEEFSKVDSFALERLGAEAFAWLADLPETAVFEGELFLCHGTPSRDDRHWLQSKVEDGRFVPTPPAEIAAGAEGLDFPLIACGHSHVARVARLEDGRVAFNPGSVGRPAYTMSDPASAARFSPAAGYGLAERRDGRWSVALRQVAYDHRGAAELARENGFPKWGVHLLEGWAR